MLARKCSTGRFLLCLIFPNRNRRQVAQRSDESCEAFNILLTGVLRLIAFCCFCLFENRNLKQYPKLSKNLRLSYPLWIQEFNLPPKPEHLQVQTVSSLSPGSLVVQYLSWLCHLLHSGAKHKVLVGQQKEVSGAMKIKCGWLKVREIPMAGKSR